MFREMRRKKQALSPAEIEGVLHRGSAGVLALDGDDAYPYALPISYVYADGKLYFHCAQSGHKLDAIRRHDKASFCVVDQDQVVPAAYTTYFRSVIAFGRIHEIEDPLQKRAAIEKLCEKYAPAGTPAAHSQAIEKDWAPLCMLEMEIDHLTGKEAVELVQQKS